MVYIKVNGVYRVIRVITVIDVKSVKRFDENIFIEVDGKGNIIGIEVWRASKKVFEGIVNDTAKKLRQ